MTERNVSMGALEWALVVILSILWGGSFFFVEVAVSALAPLTVAALRVGLAALALNLLVLTMGQKLPRQRSLWLAFFTMGLLNNMVPFTLIAWSQTHVSSGLASILNATTPFFTVLAAHYLTRDEKITQTRLWGVALGFAGVVVMIGVGALASFGTDTMAQLAILIAAIAYACAGIFGRRFRQLGCSPLVTATGQVTASAIVLIPLAAATDQPWRLPTPDVHVWGAVIGVALLSTALAYILYFRVLATAGATNLLLVTFLIPVSAILLGTTVLGEQLEPGHLAGMALIGSGLAAIDGRPVQALRRVWRLRRFPVRSLFRDQADRSD
ncbi:DMT family transporter [Marinobacter sp. CA1]|uniref:DMT family transporter n=1 Tax=Marinobacter sp. CA1 TaxID=2817656 RepID=UPI001D07AAC7|nr:DMT family transporter [Marinobacter sp. CA1]UDL03583.1 DMT family transporter [Marinobacter sp. CA1]